MPVTPPNKKFRRNPIENSIGVVRRIAPCHIVPIQFQNLMPVATPIKNDIPEKNGLVTAPVVNMRCAHTPIDKVAIANDERTRPKYPKTGLPEKVAMISVITPKYGKIMM